MSVEAGGNRSSREALKEQNRSSEGSGCVLHVFMIMALYVAVAEAVAEKEKDNEYALS